MCDTTDDLTLARDVRLGELVTELLAAPDPAEAHAVRVQRTRDLIAELEILSPGALERLQTATAVLQLRRLGVAGTPTH